MPSLSQNPLLVAIIIAILGFMIGLTKSGFNALGPVLTPILSLVLPVTLAVGVLLPMLMFGDAFAVYSYWREWDGRLVGRMLPAAVVGALAGTYLLVALPANALRLLLAGFVVVLLVYKFASDRLASWRYRPQGWHAPASGALTGVASAMFNNGGLPFNSFLLFQGLTPRVFIGTSAIFFALLNLVKLPAFLYTGVLNLPLLVSLWWVFLFIPLGIWVGRVLVFRIDRRLFEWVIVALLIFTCALLIGQSL